MIELSNNEAATLIKLAARGVQYPWGLGEEAAYAGRWLIDRQLPALELFSALFAWADERQFAELILQSNETQWHCGRSELCPLVCGTAIIDTPSALLNVDSIDLNNVVSPLLLLPFLSEASLVLEKPIRLSCGSTCLTLNGTRIELLNGNDELLSNRGLMAPKGSVSISVGEGSIDHQGEPSSADVATSHGELWPMSDYHRISAELNLLESLKQYAHRTYAPATEQSRLSGAGAGTSDND